MARPLSVAIVGAGTSWVYGYDAWSVPLAA